MIPQRAAVLSMLVAFILHTPYFFKRHIKDGDLIRTPYSLHDADLYYSIVLMVITKAIPLLVLFITNILLLLSVNKAIKRRKRLVFQHTVQVS